ncbi:MAG: hypothetical protein AAB922_06110 [Patescibacteria group bacterium]
MPILNTATSIVDFLKGQNKPSDFASRSSLYANSGLSTAFGDYRGSEPQNVALRNKLSSQAPAPAVAPGPVLPEEDKTPKDVIDQTTPSTIQNIYDLAKSDEEKAAEAANVESSMALAASAARAGEGLQRDVGTLNRTAAENIAALAQKGQRLTTQTQEKYAAAGLFRSGKEKGAEAQIAQDVATKQASVQAKLGDQLYNSFSDFEKNYGTEFLSKLSIPEAESFSKLPVAVRGIVMQNYQDSIAKAQEKASKGALSTLEKLGYTVVGGQVIQTLTGRSAERAEEAGVRAEERLSLAEAAGRRAEEAAAHPKATETEKRQATIPVINSNLIKSKGPDGFANLQTYFSERMESPFSGADFDSRFSHLLSPADKASLKSTDPLGFEDF